MIAKVSNKGGAPDASPKCANCGLWIDHWKRAKGEEPPGECSASDCKKRIPLEGAQVQKSMGIDKSLFIVPLCHDCSSRHDEFYVDSSRLAPASTDACGKRGFRR